MLRMPEAVRESMDAVREWRSDQTGDPELRRVCPCVSCESIRGIRKETRSILSRLRAAREAERGLGVRP